MKTYFKLVLLFWCLSISASAQVGMPTNNPNKDAALDLNTTDGTSTKGLLLPKVALTSTLNAAPLSAHVAGMKVYNTATSGSGTTAVTPGEYYNDGSQWQRIASELWLQDGNTNGILKTIGTNDAFDLPFETNNTERMRITTSGQVLVNTSTPLPGGSTAKLQINNGTTAGALQIQDSTQGFEKVFTSDANGVGKWVGYRPTGVWRLTGTGSFVSGVDTLESGTSTIVAGDELGLIKSSTNGVIVPPGKYIVTIDHDIAGWEIGYLSILMNSTNVSNIYYANWANYSITVTLSTASTFQSIYQPIYVPGGQVPFMVPPYSATFNLQLTFTKIE